MTTLAKESVASGDLKEPKSKRNYGIDLYKIFAMYMVVVIHILNAGGIVENCDVFSANSVVADLILTFVYCVVDCFALASGYVMVNAKYKFSRVTNLWFQVVFYCVCIVIVFAAFMPEFVVIKEIIKSIFPVTFGQYWYFTAYFILCLFIPFFNYVINGISKRKYQILVALLIFVFSVTEIIGLSVESSTPLVEGYSFFGCQFCI